MATPALRVDGLGKRYRLAHGEDRAAYRTLRESIMNFVTSPLRKRGTVEEFWALNDVSFEVQPGEVVGIIGRNGAGKSTLLKILSRIMKPTTGRVEINGRVGSLLEVGTGFHPELTGRENVYLNGSILGMSRIEIAKKFDEIVAFAEVEKFLDTPVKRYSSGMYVRLAFAVAAHLEPEILIVDEVLAVGDATFQRKCITRMSEVAQGGRTVLFVSHNMQLIPELCDRAVLLNRGQVAEVGLSGVVTHHYIQQTLAESRVGDLSERSRRGDGRAKFTRASILSQTGEPTTQFVCGDNLVVRFELDATCHLSGVALAVVIQTPGGQRLVTSWTEEIGFPVDLLPGRQSFTCVFRDVRLRPGQTVLVHLWAAAGEVLDSVEGALLIDVVGSESYRTVSSSPDQGAIVCDYSWNRLPTGP